MMEGDTVDREVDGALIEVEKATDRVTFAKWFAVRVELFLMRFLSCASKSKTLIIGAKIEGGGRQGPKKRSCSERKRSKG